MCDDQISQLDLLRILIAAAGGKLIEGAISYWLQDCVTISNLGKRSCQTQDQRSNQTPGISTVHPELIKSSPWAGTHE